MQTTYGEAIREGFHYLLSNYPEVFVFGQGLWSPWYVGNSMTNLDKEFGIERIIDSPVSELACTGAAIGAAICGYRPIVVHPRMDFMLLATDQIVNQAAKWSYMFGGQARVPVTIRGIVNRGGEQGAQHSQALHSLFAHIPGLRVVMPATVADARDLLIASVLSDDPVLYIDDRWLYELEDDLPAVNEVNLSHVGPRCLRWGNDITFIAASYSVQLCLEAAKNLEAHGISTEVIDLRMINPLNPELLINSVGKTKRFCVVDGSWANCGLAGEIIATIMENIELNSLAMQPMRITLPAVPAPTSKSLEKAYYSSVESIVDKVLHQLKRQVVTKERAS